MSLWIWQEKFNFDVDKIQDKTIYKIYLQNLKHCKMVKGITLNFNNFIIAKIPKNNYVYLIYNRCSKTDFMFTQENYPEITLFL